MASIYIDEKGPQEKFKISEPFCWEEKLAYGAEPMHGYVANAWYISDEHLANFEKEFLILEEHYMNKRQGKRSELKGSMLLSRQFKFGVASMKEREIDFYTNLLKLCMKYNAENMLFSVNKMAIIVNSRLLDWIYTVNERRFWENPYLLKYTLTKYFDVEASQSAIEILLDDTKTVRELLNAIQSDMNSIIKKQKKNERMKIQVEEYKLIVNLIKKSKHIAQKQNNQISFDWSKVKFALDLWLTERNQVLGEKANAIKCYLDQGIPKKHFEELGFGEVIENCQSHEVVGIRVSDCLVAISGSYIKRLREDNIYDPDSPDVPKRISIEWFRLNEKQFNLIKLLNQFLFNKQQYSFVVDTYFDNEEFFRVFLMYISSYDSLEIFENVSKEIHIQKVLSTYLKNALNRWNMSEVTNFKIRDMYGSYKNSIDKGMMRPL